LKLKTLDIDNIDHDNIHIDEIVYRLELIYKLFNYKFFIQNNILLISYFDFDDMTFKNKIKYVDYIFTKINKILTNYINYFQVYESLRVQLENFLNPIPVNFEIDVIQSEMEFDDIGFILGIE
jgi:hypothetical protein